MFITKLDTHDILGMNSSTVELLGSDMKTVQTTADREKPRLVRVSLHKNVTLRKQYVATIPTWRRPLIGYIASIPITALGLLCTMTLQHVLGYVYFPGAFSFLTLTIIAFIWGAGPSLFAIVLCMLALDYFFIPPVGLFAFHDIVGTLQLAPFFPDRANYHAHHCTARTCEAAFSGG